MIQFNRPYVMHKTPSKRARRIVIALDRPCVMDPAMVFTHHIEAHAWIGRLYFGGVRLYWGVNRTTPTSDAYARYSSRLHTRREA